jgi:hypothetical protein
MNRDLVISNHIMYSTNAAWVDSSLQLSISAQTMSTANPFYAFIKVKNLLPHPSPRQDSFQGDDLAFWPLWSVLP